MTVYPLEFSPSSVEYEEAHLSWSEVGDKFVVSWANGDLSLKVDEEGKFPDHKSLEKLNPELKIYNPWGYSIANYHEFFIGALPKYLVLNLSGHEVTFGEPTPFAVYLFDGQHDKWQHGPEWEGVSTVRLHKVPNELAEEFLLNSLAKYYEIIGIVPELIRLEPMGWWDDDHIESIESSPKLVKDVNLDKEALICFYRAIETADNHSACVNFYRVIEYFAYAEANILVRRLRHDHTVSDQKMLLEISSAIHRDERSQVSKFINKLATEDLVDRAYDQKLIEKNDKSVFSISVYNFRNRLVHGKIYGNAPLLAESILLETSVLSLWRSILEQLAKTSFVMVGRTYQQ